MIQRASESPVRLLTPGPLSTSSETRRAMLRDWGSRDTEFIEMSTRIRNRLVELAHAEETHVCIPVQGSGTFAVEAALGTLVPRSGKVLVLVNGAYGRRIVSILRTIGRSVVSLETPEDVPCDAGELDRALAADESISDVAVVHCETTSGILNPIERVASCVEARGRRLFIDAMSAFGCLSVDARAVAFDALMASSNKCLEGVPGVGFVLARRSHLEACAGNAHSVALDLRAQWNGFEHNAQWRFTPPTHVLAAFDQALRQHQAEGGVEGRRARYANNCTTLVQGMRALGFETLLRDEYQAPIIVTFRIPGSFPFERFYECLRERGFVIYPGKLTEQPSFRVGCIGQIFESDLREFLDVVRAALHDLGFEGRAPRC